MSNSPAVLPRQAGDSRNPRSGPLSMEEFRAVYVENMRKKFEEARQRQAAGLPAVPGMAPRPQETRAEVPPLFRPDAAPPVPAPRLPAEDVHGPPFHDDDLPPPPPPAQRGQVFPVWDFLLQAALGAFVISGGDVMHWRFLCAFAVFAAIKFATTFSGRFRLRRHRLDHENDVRAEGERVELVGRRKLWYMMWKSFVTFFVAIHPSFRVEALEMEVRMDGIYHDDAARRGARAEAAAAAEAEVNAN